MKRRGITGAVLALCLLFTLASAALAGGLNVSGAKIETSVMPGKEYTYDMKVENTSDEPTDIAVEIMGYGMSATRDFVVLAPEDDNNPYTAQHLLSVSPSAFRLEPGESRSVEVTASIPAGSGEGGRYAIVLIRTVPEPGSMIATVTAVAARVLFTVSGFDINTDSDIAAVSRVAPASEGDVGLSVTVVNNGNYHYKPHIQARLMDGDGVLATASVAPGWPIIPGYARQFQLSFPHQEALPDGCSVNLEVRDEMGNLVAEGDYALDGEEQQLLPVTVSPAKESSSASARAASAEEPAKLPPAPAKSKLSWPIIGGGVAIVALMIAFLIIRRRLYD